MRVPSFCSSLLKERIIFLLSCNTTSTFLGSLLRLFPSSIAFLEGEISVNFIMHPSAFEKILCAIQITSNSFRHIDDLFRTEIRISLILSPLSMSGICGIIFKLTLNLSFSSIATSICDNTSYI